MTTFIQHMVAIVEAEWEFFGRQTQSASGELTRRGRREDEGPTGDSNAPYKRVGRYWASIGMSDLNGRNTDVPWSAAFISYVMRQAGAEDRFIYSAAHSRYIRAAIKARRDGNLSAGFMGHRISDYSPKVGDMVGCGRVGDAGVEYDTDKKHFASHCDIVVAVRTGEIDVIGGNVSNSVTKRVVRLDNRGHLVRDARNPWFVVMENRFDVPAAVIVASLSDDDGSHVLIG